MPTLTQLFAQRTSLFYSASAVSDDEVGDAKPEGGVLEGSNGVGPVHPLMPEGTALVHGHDHAATAVEPGSGDDVDSAHTGHRRDPGGQQPRRRGRRPAAFDA